MVFDTEHNKALITTTASNNAIDTIFALSSARGKAGVAVVRVSGPRAFEVFTELTGKKAEIGKKAVYHALYHPAEKHVIDKALFLFFAAPYSYTGENVVEIQCHGSEAVLNELFAVLASLSSLRMAEHGEFTRRAFENNKMDLTEAEAVADLIDAQTRIQRDQALSQLDGNLSNLYRGWADKLSRILAHAETVIDFPDEDIPDEEVLNFKPEIKELADQIEDHLNDKRKGERLRSGIKIAVIGAPNAGKSTLVNALAQRDVAIVSDLKGTTRDIIEAHLDIGGYPIILADTAGLRPSELSNSENSHDAIENEGIKRALKYAQDADLKILLFDGTEKTLHADTLALQDDKSIIVINKSESKNFTDTPKNAVLISAKTELGFEDLLKQLEQSLKSLFAVSRETPSLTRQRHRTNLEQSLHYIQASLAQNLPELLSQELRSALFELGKITGRVDVEDLLDIIFKDFCIGK